MPTIKDTIYGEMNWEEWGVDFGAWYSRMEYEENESFDLHIRANSPMDFLAIRNTHQTYQSLLVNLPIIQQQASHYLLKDSKIIPKKKERNRVSKVLGQNLRIFSIIIYEDLSSEINFDATLLDDIDTTVIALISSDGKLLDAYFEND